MPKRREVGQRCSTIGQAEKLWSVAEILQEVSELILQLFCLAHAPPLLRGLRKMFIMLLRRGRKGPMLWSSKMSRMVKSGTMSPELQPSL